MHSGSGPKLTDSFPQAAGWVPFVLGLCASRQLLKEFYWYQETSQLEVSPEMSALNEEAEKAGVLILNEAGGAGVPSVWICFTLTMGHN